MSGRRLIAVGAAALLLPASALMTTQTSSATTGTTVSTTTAHSSAAAVVARKKKRKNTRIKIEVLPQIAQYGKRDASADSAKAVVVVKAKPRRAAKNKKVKVELLSGSRWKKAGQGRTDKRGVAEILVPATRGGEPVELRAKIGRSKSRSASTAEWLAPTFTDEFSGSALGPEWSHRVPDYNPEGFRTCSRGGPEAVRVGGGTVRLSVIKDPARNDKCAARRNGKVAGKFDYRLNGHISTEGEVTFTYGVAAARIKFPKEQGQHGSFWLQPQSAGATTHPKDSGAEIDVIEYFGKNAAKGGLTSFTYHWDGKRRVKTGDWIKDSESFLAKKRDAWYKAYHVFSVEWTPKEYIFRIDGKESWRSRRGISGTAQFPILSLLSSDYEIPQLGKDKKLPQHMYVDWIRVWDK